MRPRRRPCGVGLKSVNRFAANPLDTEARLESFDLFAAKSDSHLGMVRCACQGRNYSFAFQYTDTDTHRITSLSVIAISTRLRSFSNSASDSAGPISINGKMVTVI